MYLDIIRIETEPGREQPTIAGKPKEEALMKKSTQTFRVLLAGVLLLTGCAAGGMTDVKKTGFLADYGQLTPGGHDRAALVYIKPGVDYKAYDKLMFERIVVLLSDSAEYRAVDPTLLKEMTDYYQNALFNAFKDGYQIVDQPGPGVLRVRVAITQLKPSNPAANTLSTIIPVGIVAAGAAKVVSGDNLGTGEAATEMEVLDSISGERLAAAVDRRQGGKGMFRGKWEDTTDAFDFWAKRFRQRLDEMSK
jgi:hypothetical protein